MVQKRGAGMLPSRKFGSPEEFVHEFMRTLTPGVIPRSDFIQWSTINEKLGRLGVGVQFYAELAERVGKGADFVRELADSLLASDDPLSLIKCAFELLGHTNKEFVTKEDDIDTVSLAESIVKEDEQRALYFANILKDLGFERILERNGLRDLLLGVQIGLETHRRKNVGGDAFMGQVGVLLLRVIDELRALGVEASIESKKPQTKITYGQGLSKEVDFVLLRGGSVRFGIEVNFYTVSGSKPTEIKRSYGEILRGMQSVGIDFVWITDGKGYREMQRSLRDAYVILPNIYNYKLAEEHLVSDIAADRHTS
jgi:type II restriction enzyme